MNVWCWGWKDVRRIFLSDCVGLGLYFLVVVNYGDLLAYGGVRGQFVEGLLWGLFANLYCTTG